MNDPKRKIDNWEAGYNSDAVKAKIDRKRQAMSEHYVAAVAAMYGIEEKTREVLNTSGVQTIQYVPYLSFSRQLYKLSRQREISGNSFAMAAYVLVEKWRIRGLDRAILARIRDQVFNIGEPAVP
jgi:hypothetical protein